MRSLNDILTAMIGANWRTTVIGYVKLIIAAIAQYVMSGQPIPSTAQGWLLWAYGLVGVVQGHVQKDAAVSNAPKPGPAQPV